MGFLQELFLSAPCPPGDKAEVRKLLIELIEIGRLEDYLSERPGFSFNAQCRHTRARKIGTRLNAIGGLPLMEYALKKTRKKLGKSLTDHLEYAWAGIGDWLP